MNNLPQISFIIVARNAEKDLPNALADLSAQNYPKDKTEVLLINGISTDGTLPVMELFRQNNPQLNIKIIPNHKKTLSAGWNRALENSNGEIIIRIDAHARIPANFISQNVKAMSSGENIVGGWRKTILPNKPFQKLFAVAENSKFGAGSAKFKNKNPAGYIDTIAHAAYRRQVFQAIGGYNENFARGEDIEIHQRMKQSGFKFYYTPDIVSYHTARADIKGLVKQKFFNGFWGAISACKNYKSARIRHYTPFIFTAAYIGALVFGVYSLLPFALLNILYFAFAVIYSAKEIKNFNGAGKILTMFLPFIFFTIHISQGLGFIWGLICAPSFIKRTKNYKLPFPVK